MPTSSSFYGIMIQMYWDDHAPPHFHATYGSEEALFAILDGRPIKGTLPRRVLKLVRRGASDHRDELVENWLLCQRRASPRRIAPLR